MRKCLVVDLDNTLWGGVLGEDGFEGIRLSLTAPGNSFVAFQQAILDLHERGVILAINSHNHAAEALAAMREHPHMLLRERHFAAMRMNWNDKVDNLRDIARELNIGLDSLVFLDDDPVVRACVRANAPEVGVPELPSDPMKYARFLAGLPYFPSHAITDEDALRGNFYATERLRRANEGAHQSKEAFLANLGLTLEIAEGTTGRAARLAQMTQKTNQFNTNPEPWSEAQLRAFAADPQHKVFSGKVTDKFGDYGIVLLALVETSPAAWCIRSLLMSCRAFGRGIEDAFLARLETRAREAGANRLTLQLRETQKNLPACDFAARLFPNGFRTLSAQPASPIPQVTTHAE